MGHTGNEENTRSHSRTRVCISMRVRAQTAAHHRDTLFYKPTNRQSRLAVDPSGRRSKPSNKKNKI